MAFDVRSCLRISYTLMAPIYNLFTGFLSRTRRRSLEILHLKPGERVLIVGAGTGLDLDFFSPGTQITATDLTPAMLGRLERRARRLGLTVDARVMDGQELQFPEGRFDAVILHLILAVIPDPVRCLQEAARVLRPGGRAIILDKFISDGRQPPFMLRLLNVVTRRLATNVTRQLGPILAGSGLVVTHQEPALFHGYFQIVLVTKNPPAGKEPITGPT